MMGLRLRMRLLLWLFVGLLVLGVLRPTCAQSTLLFSRQGTLTTQELIPGGWGGCSGGFWGFNATANHDYGIHVTLKATKPVEFYIMADSDIFWGDFSTCDVGPGTYHAKYEGSTISVNYRFPSTNLWWFVFFNPNAVPVQLETIGYLLLPSEITLEVSSHTLMFGAALTMSGAVDPPASGGSVRILAVPSEYAYSSFWDESYRNYAHTLVVDSVVNGKFSASIPTMFATGVFLIFAEWIGNDQYSPAMSRSVEITVTKAQVSLKVVSSTPTEIGVDPISRRPLEVTVSGTLSPPVPGANILIMTYGPDGTARSEYVTTNSEGAFTSRFLVDQAGSWKVEVSWDGNANYEGFSNSILIGAEWDYTWCITIALIVVILLFSVAGGIWYVLRRSKSK